MNRTQHHSLFPRFALLTFAAVCLFAFACFFACKNAPAPAAKPATISSTRFDKTQGKDCDKPEDERMNCCQIQLRYPSVETGGEALKKNVSDWALTFLSSNLLPGEQQGSTLESAAKVFLDAHQEELKENESMATGHYQVDSKDTVLLNDGKHLTLQIDGYSFAGGNHPNLSVAVATFDCETGKRLTWDDLVTDKAALKALAQKEFEAARSDLFKPTDGSEPQKFDEEFKFDLPKNYGLVKDGILFNYPAGEIFLVVLGETGFVLPFSELGPLLKPAILGAGKK
jgi:hypothetical protein